MIFCFSASGVDKCDYPERGTLFNDLVNCSWLGCVDLTPPTGRVRIDSDPPIATNLTGRRRGLEAPFLFPIESSGKDTCISLESENPP